MSVKGALSAKVLAAACLLLAIPLWAADSSPADPHNRALKRSLLFPGLGQIGEKRYVTGLTFAAGEVLCLVQALVANHSGNQAYRSYRAAVTPEEATTFRRQTERYDRRRNLYIVAGAGVWLLNMLDIWLYTKKKYEKKVTVALHPQGGQGLCLAVLYSF